jgi:hypothetical protein
MGEMFCTRLMLFCAIAEPHYLTENKVVFSIATQIFALFRKDVSLLAGGWAPEGRLWERD